MTKYTPCPRELDDVELPADVLALTETLAENVHEVWAAGRIAQGWTYGEKQDDALKQTPCLVPYDELPESEKEYDRKTALSTLRLVTALGFGLEKKD